MNAVAYCHPFVPPEWIAAHGLRPYWLPCRAGDEPAVWVRRGMCPVAAARFDDFSGELPADTMYPWSAVILTTTCDQIRYAAALLQHQGRLPVFLLHVPRTWQTAAVRAFYGEELNRFGRFLVGCGGTAPTDDALSQTMLGYDRARAALRLRRPELSAAAYARAIAAVRGHDSWVGFSPPSFNPEPTATEFSAEPTATECAVAVGSRLNKFGLEPALPVPDLPLALVGGPMSQGDYDLLTAVENAGGRFVLDATESGERTLPAAVDVDRLKADPREELVRIYFDSIADVFQRPNDRMFAWLRAEVIRRRVRGILVRRYVWCDHWHGEMPRLREELDVPILEWEAPATIPAAGPASSAAWKPSWRCCDER